VFVIEPDIRVDFITDENNLMLRQNCLIITKVALVKDWPVGFYGLLMSMMRGLPPSAMALEKVVLRDASKISVSD